MGRVTRRVALVLFGIVFAAAPTVAAAEALLVPGGAASLRRITGIPDHIPDSMLLAEAARAWFGVREPTPSDARRAAQLAEYLATSKEPLQPGPWLPLSTRTWMRLLEVKSPGEIAAALARNRHAMLLYRGLTGMDDGTLAWLDTQPDLLADILARSAPVFATAGPSIVVSTGTILVPGGATMSKAWSSLLGEVTVQPADFIRRLLARDNGRTAWMYATLSVLDPARVRFAAGEDGSALARIASVFATVAPEWDIRERAFSRPAFDPTIPLMLVDVTESSSPVGTDQFWREVFRSDDPQEWREPRLGAPLTGATLLDVLFDAPAKTAHARSRWEMFSLGQRILRTAKPGREAGVAVREAMRFPVLAVSLERMGVLTPPMLQRLSEAASRVAKADPDADRGDLRVWQAALVTVERAAISGGLDPQETAAVVTSFSGLPLSAPRRELTTWFFEFWVARLLSRPGAPKNAEWALLRAMSGDLTAGGERKTPEFNWEDLPYSLAAERHAFLRMREALAAQGGPTLDDARIALSGAPQELSAVCRRLQEDGQDRTVAPLARRLAADLGKGEATRIDRERRELAEAIVGRVLPLVAYAPEQAASDAPTLGGDIALRHEIVMNEGPDARRRRPWQLAVPVAFEGRPWHLAGSLLSLDVPLSTWYLRANGEAPMGPPTIEELAVCRMALTGVLATTNDAVRIANTLDAIEGGRTRAATASDLAAVDALLASFGIDPWRRRALLLDVSSPSDVAQRLTPSEAWRVGAGATAPVAPRLTLDGCPCLGEAPFAPSVVEGRPSNGMVGAIVQGMSLRIISFLQARRLPLALYRPLIGGVAFDVIHGASAVRTDDTLALDVAAARISDMRLEEHVLALIDDGTLAPPPSPTVVH